MDKETWMSFCNEAEPLLRELRQIAKNYRLVRNPLSIAVFADENSWIDFIDEGEGQKKNRYELLIDSQGVARMSDHRQMYIKG